MDVRERQGVVVICANRRGGVVLSSPSSHVFAPPLLTEGVECIADVLLPRVVDLVEQTQVSSSSANE